MSEARRKHLLVVDDEPVIVQILKAVFEEEPYRLTLLSSGRDALRVIAEFLTAATRPSQPSDS